MIAASPARAGQNTAWTWASLPIGCRPENSLSGRNTGRIRPGLHLSTNADASVGIRFPAKADVKRFRTAKSPDTRSEEHTSELQSLMRISYAVFCLKKKNTQSKQRVRHIYYIELLYKTIK